VRTVIGRYVPAPARHEVLEKLEALCVMAARLSRVAGLQRLLTQDETVRCGLALDAFACKFSPTAPSEITRQATDLSGSYILDVWLTQR